MRPRGLSLRTCALRCLPRRDGRHSPERVPGAPRLEVVIAMRNARMWCADLPELIQIQCDRLPGRVPVRAAGSE